MLGLDELQVGRGRPVLRRLTQTASRRVVHVPAGGELLWRVLVGRILLDAQNRSAFRKCRLLPRVMRDVLEVRPQTTLFGVPSPLPIYVSPSSNALLGHPDGELNITRGVSYRVVSPLKHRPPRRVSFRASRLWRLTP